MDIRKPQHHKEISVSCFKFHTIYLLCSKTFTYNV